MICGVEAGAGTRDAGSATPVLPSISVVIPTHHRPRSLRRVLEGLARQEDVDLRQVEVVVVCDGTSDPALEEAGRGSYPFRLRVVEQEQQGPAAARNRALALSSGEVIVFVDDDVVPGAGFLRVHQAAHAYDADLVAIGPLLPPPGHGTPWVRWEGRTLAAQYAAIERGVWGVTPRQFYTGNASVRRAHLLAASGFDITFPRGEDVELAFRLQEQGLHFAFLADAQADHLAERSYAAWIRIAEAYGRFEVRMGRDHGHDDLLDQVVREFRWRHPLSRLLSRAAIRRPLIGRTAARAGRPASLLADRLHLPWLGERMLSAVFDASRMMGFAAELGGAAHALAVLDRTGSGRHLGGAATHVAPLRE